MKNPIASQAFDEKTKAEELAKARAWTDRNGFTRLLPILREEDFAPMVEAAKALEFQQGLALRANPSKSVETWDAEKAREQLQSILMTLYQSLCYSDADARLVQALRMFTIQRFGTDMLTHFIGLDDEEQAVVDAAARRLLALVSNIVDWEGEFSPEHVQAAREEVAVVAYLFAEKNTSEGGDYPQLWELKKSIAEVRESLTTKICEEKHFVTSVPSPRLGLKAQKQSGPSLTMRTRHNARLMLNTALEFLQKGDKLDLSTSFEALAESHMMFVQTLFQEMDSQYRADVVRMEDHLKDDERVIVDLQSRVAELELLLGMGGKEEGEDRFSGVGG
jgi:hypothetical protein